MKNKKYWREFISSVKKSSDDGLLEEFLQCYLTDDEIEMLSLRHELLRKLMAQKESQREISEKLKISISKVTRGSNQLKRISNRLKGFLSKEFKGESDEKT